MAAIVRFYGCRNMSRAVQLAPMHKHIGGNKNLHACTGRAASRLALDGRETLWRTVA